MAVSILSEKIDKNTMWVLHGKKSEVSSFIYIADATLPPVNPKGGEIFIYQSNAAEIGMHGAGLGDWHRGLGKFLGQVIIHTIHVHVHVSRHLSASWACWAHM